MPARSGRVVNLRTLRQRLRPPRRLRLLRPGGFLLIGVLGLGLATLNTGNNLLYLLLGALLGLIVLSGWLSEETLRPLTVTRLLPSHGATAGRPVRLRYRVRHAGRRGAAYTVVVREAELPDAGFLPVLEPGAATTVVAEHTFSQRGVHPLERITLATSFPFGLFLKERDFWQQAELVVWPPVTRQVRPPRLGGGTGPRTAAGAAAAASAERGDYRGLRPYRPGDDPRDVHWRSAARLREPIIREYDRDSARSLWICLDLRGVNGGGAEEGAVETAAALAARAAGGGDVFGLVTPDVAVPLGAGTGHLEAVLDALARARFREDESLPPHPPGGAENAAVLVTARASGGAGYADVYRTAEE